MRKMILSATALLMSGSAMAAEIYTNGGVQTAGVVAAQAYMPVSPISDPELQRAMFEAGLQHAMASPAPSGVDEWTGVGGPEEAAVWPACDPGPGDDRCIQLYERGMREAYAAWSTDRSDTAIGGPEEDETKASTGAVSSEMLMPKDPSLAMLETSSPDGSMGRKGMAVMEHPHSEALTAEEMRTSPAMGLRDGMSGYSGVGGPDDEPRVYPRCRSRSDDRCQQGS